MFVYRYVLHSRKVTIYNIYTSTIASATTKGPVKVKNFYNNDGTGYPLVYKKLNC